MVELIDTPVTEKLIMTTFHLCKSLHEKSLLPDIVDDDTVGHGIEYLTKRLSITFSIPGTENRIDEEEAPLEGIHQVSTMIRSLINNIPSVKLGP